MRAVLLAAGRGKRLGSTSPKVLTDVGGKTLLERHLANMADAGITALTIVVGFEQGQLRDALAKIPTALPIDLIDNPDFVRGSILSLQVATRVGRLDAGGIWMDADVLYPPELLRRRFAPHHRHVEVHQHHVEAPAARARHGLRAVADHLHRVGALLEQPLHHPLVDGVVFRDQHTQRCDG